MATYGAAKYGVDPYGATPALPPPPPPVAPLPPPLGEALVLVDLAGNAKAFLEPDDIKVTRRWCGGSSLEAVLDVRDSKADELVVASRALQFYVDGVIRFHGKIGEPLTSDQDNVNVVAGDPWEELTARTLTADETYTTQDGGAIAWAAINAENVRSTVRLREGTVEATAPRTVTFTEGMSRADQVTALSQLDGSFGFSLDAVDDTPGVLAEFNALAGFNRGELPGVRFEYGAGTLANCSGFTEQISRPRNRIVAQGQALADGSRPQAVAEDTASQAEYGLWEYVVSVESTDVAILQAHADAELRPLPVAVYSMTPTVEAPRLFHDFDAGHVVQLAIRHGRVDIVGTARVDDCTIRRGSGDGGWAIESLTLSSESVQRVTRSRDERLVTTLGSWRDRIARLERARVVGS